MRVSQGFVIFLLGMSSFLVGLSGEVVASELRVSVTGDGPPVIFIHEAGQSTPLPIPAFFMSEVNQIYQSVDIEDLDGDGGGEIIFHMAGGGVNSCARVLRYDSNVRQLVELHFQKGLCNFKIEDGLLISAYRQGAVWNEDIYKMEGGTARLEISDTCVGCGEVRRTTFNGDGSLTRNLVSDNENFRLRLPLVATVIALKAKIHSLPDDRNVTKKYLVTGDTVAILKFYEKDSNWVKVRFSGAVTTEGWLRYSDIAFPR